MGEYYEMRGKYKIRCYTVSIDKSMKEKALKFAQEIIRSNNQYTRLLPFDLRSSPNLELQQKLEIQRTYFGKLGELSFLKLLQKKGKHVYTEGMLEIYEGQDNVDDFDFETADQKTVDVKTGFRKNHTRLLVNVEQFDRKPKDFYVAVKIDAVDLDARHKLVDLNNVSSAKILGYAEYQYMSAHAETKNFGEDPAKFLPYKSLLRIDKLLELF